MNNPNRSLLPPINIGRYRTPLGRLSASRRPSLLCFIYLILGLQGGLVENQTSRINGSFGACGAATNIQHANRSIKSSVRIP